jgi:hypothetical protein
MLAMIVISGNWWEPKIATGVEERAGFSRTFLLEQNYPNPLNPLSVIGYTLSASDRVRLSVFDLLGREITTLVNERKAPGRYTVTWDAGDLPSGVYFYKLTSGNFTNVKKMMLTR